MQSIINTIDWKAIIEILILWFVFYRIFLFLKGTKAVYLLRGIIMLVVSFLVFQMVDLPVLSLLSKYLFAIFLIFIAIIFQPELREGLIRLGKRHIFSVEPEQEEIEKVIKEIVGAVSVMSKSKIGALIAIKREIGLKDFIESGVVLNADITSELIQSIFFPASPLHDGGLIVDNIKVISAGCLFPLTDNPNLERALGMRHRAAVGLSEASDAVVIVVSEERGSVSLSINGQLTRNLSPSDLYTIIRGQLNRKK